MVVTMQKVYEMMGLPGSGKTTWAEKKAKETGAIIISRDDIRHMLRHSYDYDSSERSQNYVLNVSQHMIKQALIAGFDIILDQLSLTKEQRERTLRFIRYHTAEVHITLVWCSEDKLNVDRRMNSEMAWGDRGYYEELISTLKSQIEEPTYDENFDEIIRIPGEKEQTKLKVCRPDKEPLIGM